MRVPAALALFFAAAPALGIASPQAPLLADYLRTSRVSGASFSHDEGLIAFLWDKGGRLDIWVKPVLGGQPRQITHVNGVIHSFAFSPREDLLLYEVDDGGNDAPRLYLTDSSGRASKELMPDFPKGSRIGFMRWAADGKSFLFITNLPGEEFTTLQEYVLATHQIRPLWK
jgi:Tol biopolymer transport system component